MGALFFKNCQNAITRREGCRLSHVPLSLSTHSRACLCYLLPHGELMAMPEEVVPYPDLPDKGCFVATAAFGADWVAEVQVLRDFRDHYLLTHEPGRAFVDWYYRHGPVAARYLDQHEVLKPLVRGALWPLVALAAFILGASVAVKVWVAFLLIMLVITLVGPRRLELIMNRYGGGV